MIKDKDTLIQYLKKGKFHKHDTSAILLVLRNEIQDNSLQEQFKFLNLFCNWSVHTKISSSMVTLDIMSLFIESLNKWDLGERESIIAFNDYILKSLKNEFFEVLKRIDPDFIIKNEDEVFEIVLIYTLLIIYERPLIIPISKINSDSKRERLSRLENAVKDLFRRDCKIESLSIEKDEKGLALWKLKSNVFIDITIPVGFNKRPISLMDN